MHLNSNIGIAGAGRIGQALGRLLRDRGEPVTAAAGRDVHRSAAAAAFIGAGVQPVSYSELPDRCSRIAIAVPDDALDAVVKILAQSMRGGEALHTCGTRGPEALAPLEARGVSCAAMHPLQTVTTP
jgi:predicted dinucleotide-binding enzyme